MKILAVDTSSAVAGCAVVDGEKLVCEHILNNKLTHSQTLMPMIDAVLRESELTAADIDIFAAVTGPGSFTGLRIGVSAVKALAHACNKPCVGVSTLEALAYNLPFSDAVVVPVMDARRAEVYTAAYDTKNGLPEQLLPPCAVPLSELFDIAKGYGRRAVFLGDAIFVYRDFIAETMGAQAAFAPASLNAQHAASAAVLAAGKPQIGYADLAPVYLRKSQAEREYENRNGGEK